MVPGFGHRPFFNASLKSVVAVLEELFFDELDELDELDFLDGFFLIFCFNALVL